MFVLFSFLFPLIKWWAEKVEFKSTLFLLILFLVSVYTSSINGEEEEGEEEEEVQHNTKQ